MQCCSGVFATCSESMQVSSISLACCLQYQIYVTFYNAQCDHQAAWIVIAILHLVHCLLLMLTQTWHISVSALRQYNQFVLREFPLRQFPLREFPLSLTLSSGHEDSDICLLLTGLRIRNWSLHQLQLEITKAVLRLQVRYAHCCTALCTSTCFLQ